VKKKVYETLQDALNAFYLNTGFNPWTCGICVKSLDGKRWPRPSKACMKALGYPIKKEKTGR